MTIIGPESDEPGEPAETFPPLAQTTRLDGSEKEIRTIGGYRIERVLGSGGMGKVYLGIDESLERKAAIKVIAEHLAPNKEMLQRLNTEARAAARLNHPNIVQVYAFGKDEKEGLTYIAFEFVDGRDIDNIIKKDGPLETKAALNMIKQAAMGLRFAYSQSIIHRDIKPANLMITKDGTVKIADFGLAKELDKDHMKTSMNAIIGSPAFMSPEQGQGRTLDFRSDIYSLGASLYSSLMGKIPFKGESAVSVILMHATEPVPEPFELKRLMNGGVMRLIKKMMAKKPEDRFQSYDELIAEIDLLLSGNYQKKAEELKHIPQGKTNSPWLKIAGVVAGIVVILMVVMVFTNRNKTRKAVVAKNTPTLSETLRVQIEEAKEPDKLALLIPTATATPEPVAVNVPGSKALALFAPDEYPADLLLNYTRFNREQKEQMHELTFAMHEIERTLFQGIGAFLPLTLFKDQPEYLMTFDNISPDETYFIIQNVNHKMPSASEFPAEVKIELAKFASSTTPPIPSALKNQFDFFRYMLFDPETKRDVVLAGAASDEARAKMELWMDLRNFYQIEARKPPPAQNANDPNDPNRRRPGPPGGGPPGGGPGGGRVRDAIRDRLAPN